MPLKNILRRMASNQVEHRNMVFLLIRDTLSGAAMIFASNTIIQAYLVKTGLSATNIGFIGTSGSVASIVGILIFMGITDRAGSGVRMLAASAFFITLTPLALVFITHFPGMGGYTLLALLVAAGIVQNMVLSLKNMLECKVFAQMIRMEICGQFLAVDGVLVSIASVCFSIVSSVVLDMLGFPSGFTLLFATSVLFFAAAAALIFGFKALEPHPGVLRDAGISAFAALPNIFRVRAFRILALPNIFRGIAAGGSYFAMAVGMKKLGLAPVYSTYLVFWGTMAAIFANVLFGLLIKRMGAGRLCLIGSLTGAASLVCLVFAGSAGVFVGLYFLMLLGQTFVDLGVPTGVFEVIPNEIMGAYTGGRLLLMSGGMALSIMTVSFLMDSGMEIPAFVLVAAIQIISGFFFRNGFYRIVQEKNNENLRNTISRS